MQQLAVAPWTALNRCDGCGSLWESLDRGAVRASVARARELFSIDVPAFTRPYLGGAAPVERVHLWLNGEALFRIVVETGLGRWQVGERGSLFWLEWREDMAGPPVSPDEAVRLAGESWGSPAASALRLALDSGFDPAQLGALDLGQAFDRETWERPWQPRTVALVDAMLAAGPDPAARVSAALTLARRSGALTEEDIRIAGFPP